MGKTPLVLPPLALFGLVIYLSWGQTEHFLPDATDSNPTDEEQASTPLIRARPHLSRTPVFEDASSEDAEVESDAPDPDPPLQVHLQTEAEKEFFIERVLRPQVQRLINMYRGSVGAAYMKKVPDSVQGPLRVRFMALDNQIEDLAISEVPYYVQAQIASLMSPAFPGQTGRCETCGINWGATADSAWP